jgi:hypothetical protein
MTHPGFGGKSGGRVYRAGMTDQALNNAVQDLVREAKKQTALLEKILTSIDNVERAVFDASSS